MTDDSSLAGGLVAVFGGIASVVELVDYVRSGNLDLILMCIFGMVAAIGIVMILVQKPRRTVWIVSGLTLVVLAASYGVWVVYPKDSPPAEATPTIPTAQPPKPTEKPFTTQQPEPPILPAHAPPNLAPQPIIPNIPQSPMNEPGVISPPKDTEVPQPPPIEPQITISRQVIMHVVDSAQWPPAVVSGINLAEGQNIRIVAISGSWICVGDTRRTGVEGVPLSDYPHNQEKYAVPHKPICSLIGKVGGGSAEEGEWQELGNRQNFTSHSSGPLYLTVNELMPRNCDQPPSNTSCYSDNDGKITLEITVEAPGQ